MTKKGKPPVGIVNIIIFENLKQFFFNSCGTKPSFLLTMFLFNRSSGFERLNPNTFPLLVSKVENQSLRIT